jgi:hypothetical protein
MSDKPVKFGEKEASDDISRRNAQLGNPGYHVDVNYIPGYSEQVMANDMAKAVKTDSTGMSEETKQGYYQRFGRKPMPLPYHFMPLRVLNTANEPLYGNQQLMNFQRLETARLPRDTRWHISQLGHRTVVRRRRQVSVQRGPASRASEADGEYAQAP